MIFSVGQNKVEGFYKLNSNMLKPITDGEIEFKLDEDLIKNFK